MPVRNEERSVAGAVRSVLAQSLHDVELLVIDGDSTDDTLEQVRRIAAVEPRVRVLRNPDRTIPHALNIGLREARGRYLARVDAHASVNDTYLECGVTTLDGDPGVAAVGGRRIGVAVTPSGVAVATALSSRFGVGDSINHYADSAQDTDHASFGVFRVDVLRAVGGWDENLLVNEDVDIDHRILSAGHRIRFDPQMCIYWHVRESIPALARQYRRYGRGKAAMVRKNGRGAVRVRHLAPPALVVALAGAVGTTVAGLWPVGVILAAPYAAALAVATVATQRTAEPVHHPAPVAPHTAAVEPVAAETVTAGSQTLTRLAGTHSSESQAPDTTLSEPSAQIGPAHDARPSSLRLVGAFMAMHLGWGRPTPAEPGLICG
jgi:hypothetical protein